jgi:MFS family permease
MQLERLPRHVWHLSLVSLLAGISGQMIHAVLPIFIISSMGGTALTIGLIEGAAAATLAVVRVFSGALSDRFKMQKSMAVIGYGISALMAPMLAIAANPLWVVLSQFGDRLGQGIAIAPRKALMADVTARDLLAHVYRLRQSLLIGGACSGATIAGLILAITDNNFRLVFSGAFIPSCMAVMVLLIAVKPLMQPSRSTVLPSEMTGFFPRSEADTRESRAQLLPIDLTHIQHFGGDYWLLLVVSACFYLGNSSDAFLLLRSLEVGIVPALIPIGLVVMSLVFAIATYPIAKIIDRPLKIRVLIGGFLLHTIVYFGFAIATSSWQIWLLFGIYGLHLAMTQEVLLSLVHRSVKSYYRPTAIGIYNLTQGIVLLVANIVAGFCWDYVGSGLTFTIGAFFAFISILFLLLGSSEETTTEGN